MGLDTMTNFAFFDFDGTLSKGFVSMDFLDYLRGTGIYPRESYIKQMKVLTQYKNGALSYEAWCIKWADTWADGLKGSDEKKISVLALEFFRGFKSNIYAQSYDLVDILNRRGYRTVEVSTGAYEVASLAAKELNIGEVYATRLETSGGRYTGRISTRLHLPKGKEAIISGFSRNHGLKGSFGFGDSAPDIELLKKVENPVALNATKELAKVAKLRGWPVLDNNDVISSVRGMIRQAGKSKLLG